MKDRVSNRQNDLASGAIKTADETTQAARSYFASDFENPERIGCPPRETLESLALSSMLPNNDLRAHLLTCSECFEEFRLARQAQQQHLRPLVNRVWLLIPQPRAALAAVFLVLLTAIAAVLVLGPFGKPPAAPVASIIDNKSEAETSSSVAGREVLKGEAGQHEQSPDLSSRNQSTGSSGNRILTAISIDLRRYSPLGAAGREPEAAALQNEKAIRLPASSNRLSLNLPPGSVKGIYVVSIAERAFLKPLVSESGNSDGKSLLVTLDMRSLPEGEYLLAISRDAEAPVYYRLIVGRSKRAAQRDQ
jgi:hypothetical protein